MPGDFALPLFDAIESSGLLPLYTLSHEPSAGFAADASARMRGAVSVAAVTYGAGALNLVNAVAAAHAEKSAVVVLSGAPGALERRGGLLVHHQAKTLDSQFAIYREIPCGQARLDDPEGLALETQDGVAFLVLNGVQTQSARVQNLLPFLADAIDMGVGVLRLSPQPEGMEHVVEAFAGAVRGTLAPEEAAARLAATTAAAPCDGYWHGRPGMEHVQERT